MIRITADIDKKVNVLDLVKRAKKLRLNPKLIIVRKSNRKGFHISVFTDKRLTKKEIFILRKRLGDDQKRLRIDMLRPFPKQYLFYKKIERRYKT